MFPTICYYLSITLFVSYVIWFIKKWGLLPSISDSYYKYYKEDKNIIKWIPIKMKYLFTFFVWGFSFTALISNPTPLLFFAITSLGITGVSPAFKDDDLTHKLHIYGAYGGVGLSQLSIIFEHHMWYISALFLLLSIIIFLLSKYKGLKNKILWVELLAFMTMFIALYK